MGIYCMNNQHINKILNSNLKKYPVFSAVLVGKVEINSKPANKDDYIAVVVGDELRAKSGFISFRDESWFNINVSTNGSHEKGKIYVYDSVNNKIIESKEVDIRSGKTSGNINEPIVLKL